MKKSANTKPVNPAAGSNSEQPIPPFDPKPTPGCCPGSCNGRFCPGGADCEAIARMQFVKFHSPFFF